MSDDEFSEADLRRTLDLAAGYLDDAETVLWRATSEPSPSAVEEELEALSHDVWTLQERLRDLRAELGDAEE